MLCFSWFILSWLAVFKGATDMFSMSSEYCSAIEQAKLNGPNNKHGHL